MPLVSFLEGLAEAYLNGIGSWGRIVRYSRPFM
jgi:hypothetical protein